MDSKINPEDFTRSRARRRELMWSVPTFYSSGQFGTSGESEPSTSSEEDRHRTQQQQQQQQQPPLLQQQLQVRQLDANQLPQQRVIELQQFQPIRLDEDSNDQRFLVATKRLYKSVCPSVGRSVRPYVMLLLFGRLGATYAVYTALLI